MPHLVVARLIIRVETAVERQIARVCPPLADWLVKHRTFVWRPIHLLASLALLWWGAQFWFLVPDSAFAGQNYRIVRLANLDLEGVLLVLDAVVLFISPAWWTNWRIGRTFPLVPQAALVLAGAAMVTIGLTVSASNLWSGGGALIGALVPVGIVTIAQAWADASAVGHAAALHEHSLVAVQVVRHDADAA